MDVVEIGRLGTYSISIALPPLWDIVRWHNISVVLCFSVVKLARERLLYIFSQSAYYFEKADFYFDGDEPSKKLEFPDILIDISNYVDPRLLQDSLYLLNRLNLFVNEDTTWLHPNNT